MRRCDKKGHSGRSRTELQLLETHQTVFAHPGLIYPLILVDTVDQESICLDSELAGLGPVQAV